MEKNEIELLIEEIENILLEGGFPPILLNLSPKTKRRISNEFGIGPASKQTKLTGDDFRYMGKFLDKGTIFIVKKEDFKPYIWISRGKLGTIDDSFERANTKASQYFDQNGKQTSWGESTGTMAYLITPDTSLPIKRKMKKEFGFGDTKNPHTAKLVSSRIAYYAEQKAEQMRKHIAEYARKLILKVADAWKKNVDAYEPTSKLQTSPSGPRHGKMSQGQSEYAEKELQKSQKLFREEMKKLGVDYTDGNEPFIASYKTIQDDIGKKIAEYNNIIQRFNEILKNRNNPEAMLRDLSTYNKRYGKSEGRIPEVQNFIKSLKEL